jgi:hypothetical protein
MFNLFSVTNDMKTRDDIHLASPEEVQDSAKGFVKEFMRIYGVGMTLQKEGKEVKVDIAT